MLLLDTRHLFEVCNSQKTQKVQIQSNTLFALFEINIFLFPQDDKKSANF